MPLILFCFGENVLKNLELFLFSTLYQSNENGRDDYMCKCTKSLTLQRYIIPKLQKSLKHAFNYFSSKGCWVLPLKKGGCFQNQQLLVRISWHSSDQHVTAASSWSSRQTLGDGNWLCGAAGPELSCNSSHTGIWMVCGRESVFGDHS